MLLCKTSKLLGVTWSFVEVLLLIHIAEHNLSTLFCTADGHDGGGQSLHYLILINPVGGKGLAVEQFQKKVQPMFDIADIRYTHIVTGKHAL